MGVKNANYLYSVDYIGKRIHLLDLNKSNFFALVNLINPTFQEDFIYLEALIKDVIDFEWIVYCQSGVVAIYKDHNFRIVSDKMPYLHKPYVESIRGK